MAAGKDAYWGTFVFIPAEQATDHTGQALLLLFSAKLNLSVERGMIPQKVCCRIVSFTFRHVRIVVELTILLPKILIGFA